MKSLGFRQSVCNPCIFYKQEECSAKIPTILAVYVDDILIISELPEQTENLKKQLRTVFKTVELGPISFILGMRIQQEQKRFLVSQEDFIKSSLKKFNLEDIKLSCTPMEARLKLEPAAEGDSLVDSTLYHGLVGTLIYLSTCSRPDITYCVGQVARFAERPNHRHLKAAHKIYSYLKKTAQYGLLFDGNNTEDFCLKLFCDADWAGETQTRKSTSGLILLLGGMTLSWKSARQSCISLSTVESEFVSLAEGLQELISIQNLITEVLPNCIQSIPQVFCDNVGAIHLVKDGNFSRKTRHIHLKFRFICDLFSRNSISLEYVDTLQNIADLFTKSLERVNHDRLKKYANMCASVEEACEINERGF